MTKTLATLATTAAMLTVGVPAASALTPVTQSAGSVTTSSAVMRGKVSALASTINVYFIYGQTTNYGSHTAVGSVLLSGTLAVTSKLTNLAPGTQYHYRFVAADLFGTYYGPDVAFTTAVPAPVPSPDTSGSGGSNSGSGSGGGGSGSDDPVDTTATSTVLSTALPGDSGGDDQDGSDGTTSHTGASQILNVIQPPAGAGNGVGADGTPAVKPALGQSVVAGTSAGAIGVKSPGAKNFATLAGNAPVPVGSIVDARRGTVQLVTALKNGATQTGSFRGAIFQVRQTRAGGGMTDIALRGGNFAACKAGSQTAGASRVVAAGRKKRVIRRLWGNDHHGRFRTRGSNSIATVRGTSWVTTDRCDGTQTSVSKGSVSVRDLHRKTTVLVRAGHSYLARAR